MIVSILPAQALASNHADTSFRFNVSTSNNYGTSSCAIDERFYRCHKSYLINLDNIKGIHTKQRKVTMVNERECLVASRKVKGLQKKVARIRSTVKSVK